LVITNRPKTVDYDWVLTANIIVQAIKAGSDAMKGYIPTHSLHVAAALRQMSGSNAD
jgi:hypothetical protein